MPEIWLDFTELALKSNNAIISRINWLS